LYASRVTPALFVVGPLVRHTNVIFAFIYKFDSALLWW